MDLILREMDGLIHPVYGKAQWVRLLDVFFVGPLMMYVSTRSTAPRGWNAALWWTGIATIAYNGANYLRIRGEVQ